MSRRRCPPGVFCIENITIVFIVGILSLIGLFLYAKSGSTSIKIHTTVPSMSMGLAAAPRKGHGDDVFFDIYQPPLRDDRCMTGGALDIRGTVPVSRVPINVSTQGTDDSEFRQIGILTPVNGNDERILPLMGRPLFTRRDKWNFYTLNDKNNMIKLPVKVNGKSGTSEYGCDNVYNGDVVYVEGYKEAFKVTAYDNNVTRYLPNYL